MTKKISVVTLSLLLSCSVGALTKASASNQVALAQAERFERMFGQAAQQQQRAAPAAVPQVQQRPAAQPQPVQRQVAPAPQAQPQPAAARNAPAPAQLQPVQRPAVQPQPAQPRAVARPPLRQDVPQKKGFNYKLALKEDIITHRDILNEIKPTLQQGRREEVTDIEALRVFYEIYQGVPLKEGEEGLYKHLKVLYKEDNRFRLVPQVIPAVQPQPAAMDRRVNVQQGNPVVLTDKILQDRQTYPRLHKQAVDKILAAWPAQTHNEEAVLFYAKKVNDEELHKDNIDMQIKHVGRTIAIAKMMDTNFPNFSVKQWDVDSPAQVYRRALMNREAMYRHIDSQGKDFNKDSDYKAELSSLKKVLNLRGDLFNGGDGTDFTAAIKVYAFNQKFKEDQNKFNALTRAHRNALLRRIDAGGDAHPYKIDLNLGGYWAEIGGNDYQINLMNDWTESKAVIDKFYQDTIVNPISLDHKKLTYDDIYSSVFSRNLNPLMPGQFQQIEQKIIENSRGNGGHWQAQQQAERTVNDRFNVIRNQGNPDDQWQERIHAIFTKVPANCVAVNIVRPGAEGYDDAQWKAALKEQEMIVGPMILNAIEDCNTGINKKIGDLELHFQDHLGMDIPSVKVIKPIATIIRNLKMAKIEELGGNPAPKQDGGGGNTFAAEENTTAPVVARQRMNLPFGLGRRYENTPFAEYGLPEVRQNQPVRIVKNLFEPNDRPSRHYFLAARAAHRQDVAPAHIVPLAPALTVKTLVEAIWNEFGKSITHEAIEEYVEGNLGFYKEKQIAGDDELNPGYQNGLFIKIAGDKPHPRALAFHMLETLGYVRIKPEVKAALYKVDFQDGNPKPGTYTVLGRARTLEQLIDEF